MKTARTKSVPDRTGCHADMAGFYPERNPVAAVGFVQAVQQYHFIIIIYFYFLFYFFKKKQKQIDSLDLQNMT